MKARTILGSLAGLCAAVAISYAADVNTGTWKLNEAKSKFAPGAEKNSTVTYSDAADGMTKVVVDGVDKDGKPVHNEWTGKFDGKDYPVTCDATADTRSIRLVSPGHYELTNKKGGKTVLTGTVQFSADNKTRTLTTHSTDSAGKQITSVAVYERQ